MTCYVPFIKLPGELITANSSEEQRDSAAKLRKRRDVTEYDNGGGWNLLWPFLRALSWPANYVWENPRFCKETFMSYVFVFFGFLGFFGRKKTGHLGGQQITTGKPKFSAIKKLVYVSTFLSFS